MKIEKVEKLVANLHDKIEYFKICTTKPYFQLLMLLFHKIIFCVSERFFQKEYKN